MSNQVQIQEIPTAQEPVGRWWPWVRWLFILISLGLLAVILLPLLPGSWRRPVYEVRDGEIVARSIAASRVIPADTEVLQVPLQRRRKIVGSSRPGYVVGRFDLARYGQAEVFGDGSGRTLLFLTRPRPTVLTPADPEALLRVWRAGDSGTFFPARHPTLGPSDGLALVILVPLLVFFLRQPRLKYILTPQALLVRTAWRSLRFPRGATKVELTPEPLGLRLFGTAIPGYYTGTFSIKTAGGGRVQALATAARPQQAVLLKLDGQTYYLTPRDPETFVRLLDPHHPSNTSTVPT
ncbi:PH domain-containing protein [Deinococcus aestuarii]|uniref:PH domain-containing protein n=1 Tax=Deinococcus aestuarii TaxID=2774531 RepID=UPI001C0E5BAC|nr:PH domain-containing protein [Deinococcus aestuarii]